MGQIMGTCLYGSLYFMTKQPSFVPGTEFTLVAISTQTEYLKSLLEPPQHLSTRKADKTCSSEDTYSRNDEATGQVCVYSVPTQDLPQFGQATHAKHNSGN